MVKTVYEKGDYYVVPAKKGYEVYQNGITAAVRCAVIGFDGPEGLRRSIEEIDRRIAKSINQKEQ